MPSTRTKRVAYYRAPSSSIDTPLGRPALRPSFMTGVHRRPRVETEVDVSNHAKFRCMRAFLYTRETTSEIEAAFKKLDTRSLCCTLVYIPQRHGGFIVRIHWQITGRSRPEVLKRIEIRLDHAVTITLMLQQTAAALSKSRGGPYNQCS